MSSQKDTLTLKDRLKGAAFSLLLAIPFGIGSWFIASNIKSYELGTASYFVGGSVFMSIILLAFAKPRSFTKAGLFLFSLFQVLGIFN